MKKIVIMLLWTISLTSCASSLMQSPTLENRSLRIDIEKIGFKYQHKECSGKLWWRKCWIVTDHYDFSDKKVREKLKLMGFKLKVTK